MSDPAFVDRDRELEFLGDLLDDARAGRPRFVLISGSAGMGKTALLSFFLEATEGVTVVRVGGVEIESRHPFGVVQQLAAQLHLPEPDLIPSADSLAAGARLIDVLGGLQEQGAVVLAIDDAQWIDEPSLQALAFALRRLRNDQLLVIACARSGEEPDELRRVADTDRGRRLRIDGLAAQDIRSLVGMMGMGEISGAAAERLREHTDGSPLHVRALIDELPTDVLRSSSGILPAPRSFAVLIASRAAGCRTETQRLLQAAAVFGLRSLVNNAAEVAGIEATHDAMDEAEQAGLVVTHHTDTGTLLLFTHPLVRAALYDDMGAERRAAMHQRAAALFEGRDAFVHRVESAAGTDDALAAELVEAALQDAMRGALQQAAEYLMLATRVTSGPHRDRVLLDAVGMLASAGSFRMAEALVEDVEQTPDSPRRSFVLGQLALRGGRHAEAERLLRNAWADIDPTMDGDLVAPLATAMGGLNVLLQRGLEAATWSERAIAVPGLPPPMRSFAFASLVVGYAMAGLLDRARAGIDLPDNPRDVPQGELDILNPRGVVKLWSDDLDGAIADLTEVVDRIQSPAYPYRLSAMGYLAEAEFRAGRWDDALAHAETAASLVEDSDQRWLDAFPRSVAGLILACRGRWDEASSRVSAAVAAATAMGDGASISYAAKAAIHLAYARDDHDGVIRSVEPILRLPRTDGAYEPGVHSWREMYAESLVALGRHDHAERVVVLAEALSDARSHRSSQANAARARGVLEAARGDADAARSAFERGLDVGADALGPFELGLLELAYGRFLRRGGQRGEAVRRLESARDRFAELGAAPFMERCETELEASGLRPTRRASRDPGQLTPQELAVARLVAQGLTNREVAARLVLSPKTIGFHLGNVFAKLGVRTRTELAARLSAHP